MENIEKTNWLVEDKIFYLSTYKQFAEFYERNKKKLSPEAKDAAKNTITNLAVIIRNISKKISDKVLPE